MPVAPIRLPEAPKPTAPKQLLVADMTYVFTDKGWLFVADNLDLYSRKIVGLAMSQRIATGTSRNAASL